MPKLSLLANFWYYSSRRWEGDKRGSYFSKGCLYENIIAQLDFAFAQYDVAVQHVTHNAIRIISVLDINSLNDQTVYQFDWITIPHIAMQTNYGQIKNV